MADIQPGFHPNFDISRFEVSDQRVLRRMAQLFHLTREGDLQIGSGGSKYRYALAKPTKSMRGILHTEREVMVIFSSYADFQPRSLDAFDQLLGKMAEDFRIEKVIRILISGDKNISAKLKVLFRSKPDAPIVVPFHTSEFSLATQETEITQRIREFTFSRDLFSMSSPLKSDLYFYGRTPLINEIVSKLSAGENFGLFGLRRSGKTSLIGGVSRAIEARSGSSVIVDCQSPSVHQLRWNELLRHIVMEIQRIHSPNTLISKENMYDTKHAAATFIKDIRNIRKKIKGEFIAILFDEIERISIGTASSTHWNEERDFLLFWQSVRAGFQSSDTPFTFLIVGTNPTCIEKPKLFESDNPLFGNVEKRFIPMFSAQQVDEMVDELGSIMGIRFNAECKTKLHQDFGGHPFLTRYACSFIAKEVSDRPVEIDRTSYSVGVNRFSTESNSYVESVVGLLKGEYEDEYEMLKYLGQGDEPSFSALSAGEPMLLEHLLGYGLVGKGSKAYFFNIGVVEEYFSRKAKPASVLSQSDRLAEISRRRNDLEKKMRLYIFRVANIAYQKNKRRETLFSKLSAQRKTSLAEIDLAALFSEGSSPLYFDELKSIILGLWSDFENSIETAKSEFEYHMNVVNWHRADAHAKDVSDHDFEKLRVSLLELEKIVED